MVKMELVSDPKNQEDSFVRVEVDGYVTVYKHDRDFYVNVEGRVKQIAPNRAGE